MSENLQEQVCAICLQKCDHPTQLPCGHIFCFLCVKGIAIRNTKCAMCRAIIPPDYLDHPILLEESSSQPTNEAKVGYQWYYEGRNGWWKYDERSNVELETAFGSGESCNLLLAGALYTIDFQNMNQVRCSDQTRRRRIRRDTPLFPAKGVAGIKTDNRNVHLTIGDEDSNANNASNDIVVSVGDEEDDDDDVQIVDVEPEVIEIDDGIDDLARLSSIQPHPEPTSGEHGC